MRNKWEETTTRSSIEIHHHRVLLSLSLDIPASFLFNLIHRKERFCFILKIKLIDPRGRKNGGTKNLFIVFH